MPEIIVIQATPGPTTKDRILTSIEEAPNGMVIRDICQNLNRPVSLVQRYLKMLVKEGKIHARRGNNGTQLVYYPGCIQRQSKPNPKGKKRYLDELKLEIGRTIQLN